MTWYLNSMVFSNPLPDRYSHSFVLNYVWNQKYFPLLQKKIPVLHIHSHTTYNVTEIEKQAAGIHPGSVGQGHCEGQRRDFRDGSWRGHWLKWCLPLLSSLLMHLALQGLKCKLWMAL